MSLIKLAAAVALAMLVAPTCSAEGSPLVGQDQPLAPLRQPEGLAPQELAAYFEVADRDQLPQPYAQTEYLGEPSLDQSYSEQPSVDWMNSGQQCSDPNVGCCDVCGRDAACECRSNYRSGWTIGFDVGALQSNMAVAAGGLANWSSWSDEWGGASRLTLGYEWLSGFGIRGQAWGFSLDGVVQRTDSLFARAGDLNYFYPLNTPLLATTPVDLEVDAGTFYLDFYKAIVSHRGELLVGAGPAFGGVEFSLPGWNHCTQFNGGGITAFGQGYYPLLRRIRWEVALAGHARLALLRGDWDASQGMSTGQFSKSMSIVEMATGLEMRRHFGRSANHYWFVRTMAEFQQWTSDRMGPLGGDTLSLNGASLNLGFNW